MKVPLLSGRSIARRLRTAASVVGRVIYGSEFASRSSYSHNGEDMVLRAVFLRYPHTYSGFYVDIGAHHPMKFSNTRYFYELGWSGICVDPLPGSAGLFTKWRPRDIFLQAGVAAEECEMTYYMFDEPALNTFSENTARENADKVKTKKQVKLLPLRRILADHLPHGRRIDFLSVDVEGLDLEVLRSNDWATFRPLVVLIEETSPIALKEVQELDCSIYMKQQGYESFARTPGALFFMDTRSPGYDRIGYLVYGPK